jgi:hypothetical protein
MRNKLHSTRKKQAIIEQYHYNAKLARPGTQTTRQLDKHTMRKKRPTIKEQSHHKAKLAGLVTHKQLANLRNKLYSTH